MDRLMGLDVGDKTIGVAVSDLLMITAQGVTTIKRTNIKNDLNKKVKDNKLLKEKIDSLIEENTRLKEELDFERGQSLVTKLFRKKE